MIKNIKKDLVGEECYPSFLTVNNDITVIVDEKSLLYNYLYPW
jgi:hypothetical protein